MMEMMDILNNSEENLKVFKFLMVETKSDLAKQVMAKASVIETLIQQLEDAKFNIKEIKRLSLELSEELGHEAEAPSMCDLIAITSSVVKERDQLEKQISRIKEVANSKEHGLSDLMYVINHGGIKA